MRKRIALFTGMLAVLVAAIGFAAVGTGAYFTDEVSGTASGTTAKVDLALGAGQSLDLSFDKLLPGENATPKNVTFVNDSNRDVDLYLRVSNWSGTVPGSEKFILDEYNYGFSFTSASPTAPILVKTLAPGENYDATFSARLLASAGNEWQDRTVTATVEAIIIQAGAPAPTGSVPTV